MKKHEYKLNQRKQEEWARFEEYLHDLDNRINGSSRVRGRERQEAIKRVKRELSAEVREYSASPKPYIKASVVNNPPLK